MNETMLRRNLRLYGWFKIFNKRVFLPVSAVYLVEVGHVSVSGIGVIATITGLVTLLAQMPTGYVADRYTRRLAMILGSALLITGVGVLVVAPSLIGGLVAGAFSGVGFAFMSGAGQALIHDSLEQCGRGHHYVKVMGRAQSMGLVGNIVLIALIPMTYTVDKRLPFVLGIAAFLVLLAISWAFVEPRRNRQAAAGGQGKGLGRRAGRARRQHRQVQVQQGVAELVAVFGLVNAGQRGPQNRIPGLGHALGQPDGCLAAQLQDHAPEGPTGGLDF
jgi:MFS family permease